jgi:hypothetical protein
MIPCPRCRNPLPDNADSCRCGWRERTRNRNEPDRHPRTTCGYDGCNTESICKLRTPTGWLHVCDHHYRIYHHDKAERTCTALGLDTVAKRKAWLRQHWPQTSAWDTHPTREPGDDWEEDKPAI